MKQIQLSGNVRVSDPCYTDDVWCKTRLTDVLPGNYNVEIDKKDFSGWGERVWSITAVHESITEDDGISFEWEDHSEIGVDSGQAGIFCETSYRNDEIAPSITTPNVDFSLGIYSKEDNAGDAWYEKMCKFTLGEESWGVYDSGVVSCSGIGDGSYLLEVMRDKEKIVGMKITFLFEEEFEEDEEEEYNEID